MINRNYKLVSSKPELKHLQWVIKFSLLFLLRLPLPNNSQMTNKTTRTTWKRQIHRTYWTELSESKKFSLCFLAITAIQKFQITKSKKEAHNPEPVTTEHKKTKTHMKSSKKSSAYTNMAHGLHKKTQK